MTIWTGFELLDRFNQTSSTATEKAFARSIVTPIVTGLMGFLLGKAER